MAEAKNSVTKKKDNTFGEKFAELETITKEFEAGEFDLDKGLEKFERGLKLAEELKKYLREAELKVENVKAKFDEVYEK